MLVLAQRALPSVVLPEVLGPMINEI